MAEAAYDFATIRPNALPTQNIAVDVWILRGQGMILTQKYNADEGLHWKFANFANDSQTNFNQALINNNPRFQPSSSCDQ